MIRDILTVSIVSLALFGSAPDQDGDNAWLQLIAATGDARRTLVRFLDQYAGLKAGAQRTPDEVPAQAGWSDLVGDG